jgi:hypothetical protein
MKACASSQLGSSDQRPLPRCPQSDGTQIRSLQVPRPEAKRKLRLLCCSAFGAMGVVGGNSRSEDDMRRWWSKLGTANQISVIGVVIAILGLLPAYLAVLSTKQPASTPSPSSSRDSVTNTSSREANLKVVDLVVLNGTDWDRPPQVQVTLHNTGSQRSIIKRALFRIQTVAALPICHTAGELMVSKKYDITLPTTRPKDAAPVEKPVSQQLGPDEADRFAFSFAVPQRAEEPAVYLYQLQIEFLHDTQSTPLRVGNVIVAAPGAPGRHGLEFWRKGEEVKFDAAYSHLGAYQATVRSCLDSNTSKLRTTLALDGARSEELANLPAELG